MPSTNGRMALQVRKQPGPGSLGRDDDTQGWRQIRPGESRSASPLVRSLQGAAAIWNWPTEFVMQGKHKAPKGRLSERKGRHSRSKALPTLEDRIKAVLN